MDKKKAIPAIMTGTTVINLIETIPHFKTTLLSYLGPRASVQLRIALGRQRLTSPIETLRYASVYAMIDVNIDWILKMNSLGWSVVLAGRDIATVNDMLYAQDIVPHVCLRFGDVFEHDPVTVNLYCVRTAQGDDDDGKRRRPPLNLDSIVYTNKINKTGMTFRRQYINNVYNTMAYKSSQGVMVHFGVREQTSCDWIDTAHMTTLIRMNTTNLDSVFGWARYKTKYMWTNIHKWPDQAYMIRKAYSRYVHSMNDKIPNDITLLDDAAAVLLSMSINSIFIHLECHPVRIHLWPPNQKTFMCSSGVYSTEPESADGQWRKLGE